VSCPIYTHLSAQFIHNHHASHSPLSPHPSSRPPSSPLYNALPPHLFQPSVGWVLSYNPGLRYQLGFEVVSWVVFPCIKYMLLGQEMHAPHHALPRHILSSFPCSLFKDLQKSFSLLNAPENIRIARPKVAIPRDDNKSPRKERRGLGHGKQSGRFPVVPPLAVQ
jgi:hypothetical protein